MCVKRRKNLSRISTPLNKTQTYQLMMMRKKTREKEKKNFPIYFYLIAETFPESALIFFCRFNMGVRQITIKAANEFIDIVRLCLHV